MTDFFTEPDIENNKVEFVTEEPSGDQPAAAFSSRVLRDQSLTGVSAADNPLADSRQQTADSRQQTADSRR